MKRKNLFLSLFLMFSVTSIYSQTSASQAGIAIQGIARDANNTARASETISFTFEIYYLDASNQEQNIFSETVNLSTDTFGVFSHIIDPEVVNDAKIANNLAFLRIKNGEGIISDERFKHVPYAISANNGVPTGSIMPYLGTTAPVGWVLCDGTALPTTATELIAMVGNNAPNLQGMFLRGTGTSTVNNQAGPSLGATQGDENKAHTHAAGGLVNSGVGNHNHEKNDNGNVYDQLGIRTGDTSTRGTTVGGGVNELLSQPMQAAGAHNHTISGNTATSGTESRPVNYGVNYIIKL